MSATKRRAGAATSPEMSTPDPAKRRRNNDTHFPDRETPETTTEIGLKLMRLLKKSQDKSGRNVATHFLELPAKDEYPEYFQQVKMPLSLNMIEAKLEDRAYDTMEQLEADLKRLVQNAKEFNATKSEIFEDAERIRKALSNFMPKHNPAYQNPDYRAYATPIPRELLDQDTVMLDSTPETSSNAPSKITLKMSRGGTESRRSLPASTPFDSEAGDSEMRTALLELLDELTEQADAENFVERPPRSIPGYYKIIQKPTSISDVRKMVERGRIKDWNAFAEEVRLIWDNCKHFNEDDSDIYLIAEELEAWFEDKAQALGASPRVKANIKLRLGQQPAKPTSLKLNFGTGRSTPNPNGGVVDNESLQRQREETGQALRSAHRASSRHATINGSTPVPASIKRSGSVATSSDQPNSVAVAEDVRPASNHSGQFHISKSLPTPVMDGQPPTSLSTNMANGTSHPEFAYSHSSNRNLFIESNNPIERRFRDPGKGLDDAILGSVTFMTHPKLPNDPRWKLNRFASATKTQTSSFIHLPSDHYYLRAMPNLTPECLSRKRHKVCVTRNWTQVSESSDTPGAYDFRIYPGENIIAVDVLADLKEGQTKSYAPPQLQLDFERITFIVILREATPA